jgi:predicted nuclease with TOPRIM domain
LFNAPLAGASRYCKPEKLNLLMDEKQPISHEIEALKTDSNELEEVLNHYDLDESLEAQFNALDDRFRQLEIKYQSLLNTRRYLQNG